MEDSICERIKDLIKYYGISDRQFAIKIGVNQSVIGSMFQKQTEPSAKVIKLILSTDEDISSEWLLRGKGRMLLSEATYDPNIERIERLVDTLTTLQRTINEQTKTIQLYEEENKKLKGELTMIKNERNVS